MGLTASINREELAVSEYYFEDTAALRIYPRFLWLAGRGCKFSTPYTRITISASRIGPLLCYRPQTDWLRAVRLGGQLFDRPDVTTRARGQNSSPAASSGRQCRGQISVLTADLA